MFVDPFYPVEGLSLQTEELIFFPSPLNFETLLDVEGNVHDYMISRCFMGVCNTVGG